MRPNKATGGQATANTFAGSEGSLKPFSATRTDNVSQTNGTATTPNCIVSSSHQLGFGVCTCFCVADQYAQSLTTAYPKPGTPNLDLATATLRCRKVLMKPIWRKAAVGTPAKQPIAVAVDQPPETSELPVELEAWASMAAYCVAALLER